MQLLLPLVADVGRQEHHHPRYQVHEEEEHHHTKQSRSRSRSWSWNEATQMIGSVPPWKMWSQSCNLP